VLQCASCPSTVYHLSRPARPQTAHKSRNDKGIVAERRHAALAGGGCVIQRLQLQQSTAATSAQSARQSRSNTRPEINPPLLLPRDNQSVS